MSEMLNNSETLPAKIAMDFTCESRLLDASKDNVVHDKLRVLGRGEVETHLQDLESDNHFVRYSCDLHAMRQTHSTILSASQLFRQLNLHQGTQ